MNKKELLQWAKHYGLESVLGAELLASLSKQTLTELVKAHERRATAATLPGVPTKLDLLAHYTEREPNMFYQYDVFVNGTGLLDNDDGFEVWGRMETYELMNGSDVRLLIKPNVTHYEVVRCLVDVLQQITGDKEKWGEGSEAVSRIRELTQRHEERKPRQVRKYELEEDIPF